MRYIKIENLITALQIFLKYGNPRFPTCCEHDILFIDIDPHKVSAEDKNKLYELGFCASGDNSNFYSYIFGSY